MDGRNIVWFIRRFDGAWSPRLIASRCTVRRLSQEGYRLIGYLVEQR